MEFYELKLTNEEPYAVFLRVGEVAWAPEWPVCPDCGARIGVRDWLPPHNVRIQKGRLGDLCTNLRSFFVSERARQVLERAKLVGLRFSDTPVSARRKIAPGYLVYPPHTLTLMDEEASGIVLEELVGCDTCRVAQRKRVECIRVQEATWRGEDIFKPSGLFGVILVTSRFVETVEAAALSNFHFVHQDHYRKDWNW
ncbi:MAG: hypothetical protein JXP73_09060 [Deltaproteobacteria bacterium]|nr:hypothetical protein [Deltaproteobacteria bacterium]